MNTFGVKFKIYYLYRIMIQVLNMLKYRQITDLVCIIVFPLIFKLIKIFH